MLLDMQKITSFFKKQDEIDSLENDLVELKKTIDGLNAEKWIRLNEEYNRISDEKDSLYKQNERLIIERDHMIKETETIRAERDALKQENIRLRKDPPRKSTKTKRPSIEQQLRQIIKWLPTAPLVFSSKDFVYSMEKHLNEKIPISVKQQNYITSIYEKWVLVSQQL